jgi:hypothetical protein
LWSYDGTLEDILAAMDLLVVPTIGFRLLYVLVILDHGRRRIRSFGVTAHPTAEWVARQITDAFPWAEEPRYLIRDRDSIYGEMVSAVSIAWAFAIGRPLRDHLYGRM